MPEVLESALRAFHASTGLPVRLSHSLLTIGKKHHFTPEVKAVDRFAVPALIKARHVSPPILLVAPYISRQSAEHCRALNLPFIDTAGNAYIETGDLFVYVVGNPRPAAVTPERFRALTPAGLQLTFALLSRPDLLDQTYRTIAQQSGVALGTVGPVIKDLQNRGFIHAGADRQLRLEDRKRLIEEWTTRYPTTLRPKLETRTFEADPQVLVKAKLQNAFWGGEPAADRLTHMLRPQRFTIYSADTWTRLAARHRLRAHSAGNVEVLKAFWRFTLDGFDPDITPPLLVYADLMATRDGRNIEVANLVYERYLARSHAR